MFTQHQTPSPSTNQTIEQLRSALIMSGIPSHAFTTSEFTRDGTDYAFITPTFDTSESEFITARWVWLLTYDTRFLATTRDGNKGYALPKHKIANITGRLAVIDSEPEAAIHTYFIDHNMNPEHISVEMAGDYLSEPEDENTLTVTYTPSEGVPAEARDMELDAWNEATTPDLITDPSTSDHTATISVTDARTIVADRFTSIKDDYWQSQANSIEWTTNAQI